MDPRDYNRKNSPFLHVAANVKKKQKSLIKHDIFNIYCISRFLKGSQ